MRHRGQITENSPSSTGSSTTELLRSLTDIRTVTPSAGKHRAPVTQLIPEQTLPTHDTNAAAGATARPVLVPRPRPVVRSAPAEIPATAQWKASHLPRVIAATLLAMAVLGTSGLGVRYSGTRTSDNFASLVIGLVVVVVLWALVIASTPQVVNLEGSILTIHNTGGSERFDLADGLQPIDVVGDPRTSHWAVLLHRHNSPTIVLRRHDVVATELDPIVRHYRNVADRRLVEREARFNR